MKKRNVFRILAVLATLFIFSNSLKPANLSSEDSGRIVAVVSWFLELFGKSADRAVLQNIVRKIAHFAEFGLQGTLLLGCFDKKLWDRVVYVLFFGLLTACTDEFLQLFAEGRGSQIQDVFIDFAGTAAGILFGCAVWYVWRRRK